MSSPVYLLSGEPFLADEALEAIRRNEGTDPLAEVVFDAAVDAAELLNALETPSLLGGRRLVVVRGANELRKEQVDALRAYLASPSPDAVLVLVSPGRTKLDGAVRDAGEVMALEAPRGRRLVAWLRSRAVTHGVNLDERAAWALIDAVGGELRDLDAALRQVAAAGEERVRAADVHRLFPRHADERVFAFTDAVGMRRVSEAMTALRRLLEQGDEPLMLFGVLSGHVRRLLAARPHAERGAAAVARAMGMPRWRAERIAQQALAYREDELVAALGVLAQADLDLKGDAPVQAAVLERAVLQVVTGAAPAHLRLVVRG